MNQTPPLPGRVHWRAFEMLVRGQEGDMLNDRFPDRASFEAEVLSAVRKAK